MAKFTRRWFLEQAVAAFPVLSVLLRIPSCAKSKEEQWWTGEFPNSVKEFDPWPPTHVVMEKIVALRNPIGYIKWLGKAATTFGLSSFLPCPPPNHLWQLTGVDMDPMTSTGRHWKVHFYFRRRREEERFLQALIPILQRSDNYCPVMFDTVPITLFHLFDFNRFGIMQLYSHRWEAEMLNNKEVDNARFESPA